MEEYKQAIELFFKEYEDRFSAALLGHIDSKATANAFAECFIEANPHGVMCGKNDEHFLSLIPQGVQFYKSIGTKVVKILSLSITFLDDFHAMTKVYWKAFYETKQGKKEEIEFEVIYFLQLINSEIKIFAYLTGDEPQILRERGIITD